jgi:hypothetical protein
MTRSPEFEAEFSKLGYQWSESNKDKAFLGWMLSMMKHQTQWDDLTWHLTQIEHPLQYLIAATPTGPVREALTEANILFMQAEESLKRAATLAKEQT